MRTLPSMGADYGHQKSLKEQERTVGLEKLNIDEKCRKIGVRFILRPSSKDKWKNIQVSAPEKSVQRLSLPINEGAHNEADQDDDGNAIYSTIIAVSQSPLDVKFSLLLRQSEEKDNYVPLDLYFDPLNDDIIFRNVSELPLGILIPSENHKGKMSKYNLFPTHSRSIVPTTGTITVVGKPVLDFRIFCRPRSVVVFRSQSPPASHPCVPSHSKRPHPPSQDTPPSQQPVPRKEKHSHEKDDSVIISERPVPQEGPNTDSTKVGDCVSHPLILSDNETLRIPEASGTEQYQLARRCRLATAGLADLYLAHHSTLNDVIVVKVLKTAVSGKRRAVHKSIVSQAETWLREYSIQKQLQHVCVQFTCFLLQCNALTFPNRMLLYRLGGEMRGF